MKRSFIAAAALLIVGCTSPSSLVVDPPPTAERSAEPGNVTFYIAGMNQRLQIL